MKNTEPIKTHLRSCGRYYANINGISRGSIGCYFDINGNLVAHTLERGSKYDELLVKLLSEIATRGVQIESQQ